MNRLNQLKNKIEKTKTCIDAHKTLIEIDSNNYSKFKLVIELLEADLISLNNELKILESELKRSKSLNESRNPEI